MKRVRLISLSLGLLILLMLSLQNCKKSDPAPSLPTFGPISVVSKTDYSVALSATVISGGNIPIVASGLCVSKNNPLPEMLNSDALHTSITPITQFPTVISGTDIGPLTARTRYSARAFVITNVGNEVYSDAIQFTTQ